MEENNERQTNLANEINEELDGIISRLYELSEVIDNEKEGYGLTPELKHCQKVIKKIINASIA